MSNIDEVLSGRQLSGEGEELSRKYNGLRPVTSWVGDTTGATEFNDGAVAYWTEGRDGFIWIEYPDGRTESVNYGPYFEFAEIGEEGEVKPKIKITLSIEGGCHGIYLAEDGAKIYWKEGRGHEEGTVILPDGTRGRGYRYEDAEDWTEEVEYRDITGEEEAEWEANFA